jgi:hypothetical protein
MLPNLPKKYKRAESKIDGLVIKWFEDNYHRSCALEIKIKGGKLKEHQKAALKKVHSGKFSHKMADMGRRNPFDAFVLIKADAIVVTCDGRKCHAVDGALNCFDFEV